MIKAVALGVGSTLAVSAVAAGGIYLPNAWFDDDLPVDVGSFRKTGEGEGCIKAIFPGVKSLDIANGTDRAATSDDLALKDVNGNGSDVRGCLVVNWEKWTKDKGESKRVWFGQFRALWAMAKGDSGFAVFLVGITDKGTDNAGIKYQAAAYGLRKEGDLWKVDRQTIVTAPAKTDMDRKLLPENAQDLDPQTKWGFIGENETFENLCAAEDKCTENPSPQEHWRNYWYWDGASGEGAAHQWSTNIETWGAGIFGDAVWKVKEKLQEVKGTWRRPKFALNVMFNKGKELVSAKVSEIAKFLVE